jgi:hypothetical protein
MYKILVKRIPEDIVNIITKYLAGDSKYWRDKYKNVIEKLFESISIRVYARNYNVLLISDSLYYYMDVG